MITRVLLLISFFSALYGFAQQDYKGQLLDAQTGEPLPYVSIGVLGEGIGTVSDEERIFHLTINTSELTSSDVVQFSSIGYETIKKMVADLEFVYNGYPVLKMKPRELKLNEVVVTNKGSFEISDIVGYQNYGERTFGYWKDNIALGGELATKIKVKKGLRKLNTLFFEVFSNISDTILVRVNIYNLGKSKKAPGENINSSNQNILYTIYPTTKLATVDLTPFSLYVKDDFFVSLELLKVYHEKPISLILAASSDKSTYSLRTYASMDKWERLNETAMAYYLNTTYFTESKRAESKVVKAEKSKQNISGFVFASRRPVKNIKITNLMTNQEAFSNEKGRYEILGEKDDVLSFEGEGLKKKTIILFDKITINMNLQRE